MKTGCQTESRNPNYKLSKYAVAESAKGHETQLELGATTWFALRRTDDGFIVSRGFP